MRSVSSSCREEFPRPAQALNPTGHLGLFSPHPRTAHDLRLLALAGDIITDESVLA